MLNSINGVESVLERKPNRFVHYQNRKLMEEFKSIILQKEPLWKQKSHDQWISLGDHNTRYFHTLAKVKQERSRILTLRIPINNNFIIDQKICGDMAAHFFHAFYIDESTNIVSPYLSQEKLNSTCVIPSILEVRNAPWTMSPIKALGLDGLPIVFHQSYWEIPSLFIFLFFVRRDQLIYSKTWLKLEDRSL